MLFAGTPSPAQFAPLRTKLKPNTQAEFQTYVHQVESELQSRWDGKTSFLRIAEDPAALERVKNGEVWVEAGCHPNPRTISDGLIHDWFGAVYIPNKTIQQVIDVLQDFQHHAAIYPPVIKSRLISRNGDDVTGYWRLEEKGQMLPAVFDVTQTVHYREISPDKWIVQSHANDIRAVEDAGSKNEKVFPPGEGDGLMWKLYSYWNLEKVDNGVIAECRTVSLSRGIPPGLGWMVKPFVNAIPRNSMDSTLRSTRKASGG